MSGIATAIIGGAVIAGGASIYSAEKSSSAAEKQANAMLSAASADNQLKWEMYQQSREDIKPWMDTGKNALADLWKKVQAGPGEFTESPGYQFRLTEGKKAIENAAASKGNALSASTVKALQRYGEDYATNDYQNFLANYYNSLTPYQSLAGSGQTAVTNVSNLGASTTNSMGNENLTATTNAANMNYAGTINELNAINKAASIPSSMINNYVLWKYLGGGTGGIGGKVTPSDTAAVQNVYNNLM